MCDKKEKMDNTLICSLDSEGINRSKLFLGDLLRIYKCDFLCLQEVWCLDVMLYRLGTISTDYMSTAIYKEGETDIKLFICGK